MNIDSWKNWIYLHDIGLLNWLWIENKDVGIRKEEKGAKGANLLTKES